PRLCAENCAATLLAKPVVALAPSIVVAGPSILAAISLKTDDAKPAPAVSDARFENIDDTESDTFRPEGNENAARSVVDRAIASIAAESGLHSSLRSVDASHAL